MPQINWIKVAPWIVGGLLGGIILWWAVATIYHKGQANVQAKWDAFELARNQAIRKEEVKIAQKEAVHTENDRKISNELVKLKKNYDTNIGAIAAKYESNRVQQEQRVRIYQRNAEGSAVERANLASYASQLDASLVEGQQLVEELVETIKFRDGQIIQLAEQINNDRKLLGDSDATSSTSGNDSVHPE